MRISLLPQRCPTTLSSVSPLGGCNLMTTMTPLYETPAGKMYCGRAEELLESPALLQLMGRVQLILTSPPFPLNTKKKYGNKQGQEYLKWLSSFAGTFRDYLTEDGSVVIELGNAWKRGMPVLSTLPIRSLLAFLDAGQLHLCQEFICYNTARLPSPAQWVTVERIRVKDAFTRLWWMAASPRPKADNRRILTAYSKSMQKLLDRGTYNPGVRPSGYRVGSGSFLKRNEGAIPPNVVVPADTAVTELLPLANTQSHDPYLSRCRAESIDPHPARMSLKLVEFFVSFLTDRGDLVLDPFAGSNSTGFVAEALSRKWVALEVERSYAASSELRFREAPAAQPLEL